MRIALGLEYDGSPYFGWQRQHEVPSVQEHLEVALAKVAAHPVQVVCAGRTDAGVHATGQVVHFDTESERSPRAWTLGVNTHLPDGIAVQWMTPVSDNFSARFSATARRYRYLLHNGELRPGIGGKAVTHFYPPLDADAMHDAAQCLVGEQDFSSFRAAQCQSNTPNRNIHFIHVCRLGDYVIVDIQANAFVHHMVRNIVGSLCLVGRGEQNKAWLEDVLAARDRTLAAATAKPNGLYLVDVLYPDDLGLPKTALGPLFLPDQLPTV